MAGLSIGLSGAVIAIPLKPVRMPSAITLVRARVEAEVDMFGLQGALPAFAQRPDTRHHSVAKMNVG